MPVTINGTSGVTFPDSTLQTTAAGLGGMQVYSTAQTNTAFTIPASVTKLKVTVVGGGGGGGASGTGQTGAGGGGGGGGSAISFFTNLTPGNTILVTVGAGGVAGGSGGTSSVSSGTQTISTISATGGSGGVNDAPGIGGIGSNGILNLRGGSGISGLAFTDTNFAPDSTGYSNFAFRFGNGGDSIFGGGAQPPILEAVGIAGTNAGGGSGGITFTGSNRVGASGGLGIVLIEW